MIDQNKSKWFHFFKELEKQNIPHKTDPITNTLYSKDASIYQIKPNGVIFPENTSQIQTIVKLAKTYSIPLTVRGAGTNTTGSALGEGVIINLYHKFDKILEIDSQNKYVLVQPGVVYEQLNQAVSPYDLIFGPDPASGNRASIGGMLGTNATGSHSIMYGMTSDQVIGLEVILSDGSNVEYTETGYQVLQGTSTKADQIAQLIKKIQTEKSALIQQTFPHVWRKSSGYNLDKLIGWSKTQPSAWESTMQMDYPPTKNQPNNLIPLFIGAEGTLGIITKAKLRLVDKPKQKNLVLIPYQSTLEACQDVERLLAFQPTAIELLSHNIMAISASIPAYADNLSMLPKLPQALLVVEFMDSIMDIQAKLTEIHAQAIIVSDLKQQANVWEARKAGLGIINAIPGEEKPQPLIEDVSVPIPHLAQYVADIQAIFDQNNLQAEFYAHASAGCLHIRPIMSIKTENDQIILQSILDQVAKLCIKYNGVISGEHGDGLIRGPLSEQIFHPEINQLFEKIKNTADEKNIFNPNKKIFTSPPLSYPIRDLSTQNESDPFFSTPTFSFKDHLNVIQSIEMCNGAGVCLQTQSNVMCPSYKVLKEELFSPRGRANLFREYLSATTQQEKNQLEQAILSSIDHCFECKGCKSECPSTVDISRLKYEFLNQYYKTHRRKLTDYIFGYFNTLSPILKTFSFVINPLKEVSFLRNLAEKFFGLSQAYFPPIVSKKIIFKADQSIQNSSKKIFIIADSFNLTFEPENIEKFIQLFQSLGYSIEIIPFNHSGRTFISKGFLKQAKAYAKKVIDYLKTADPHGKHPIIGIEPSEIITFRDEYQDFFPEDPYVKNLFSRSFMFDEYLLRNEEISEFKTDHTESLSVHGHCYQKSAQRLKDKYPVGVKATCNLLEQLGYNVTEIPSGCCGMAGSFGYESKNYDLSMQVGEGILFPAVRDTQDIIIAPGVSCRGHIKDGTNKTAIHPIHLIERK